MSQHSEQFVTPALPRAVAQSRQEQLPKLTFLQKLSQQYRRFIWLFVAVTFCSFLTSFHWDANGYATLPGTIRVHKLTQPATTNIDFDFVLTRKNFTRSFALGHDEVRVYRNLDSYNVYQIAETLPTGWVQTAATCSDGSPVTAVALEENETVTCTFTNTQLGKLVVRKSTSPNPDRTNADFSFTTGGALPAAGFTLKSGQQYEFANLLPGNGYSVSEQPLTNWQLRTASCDNSSPLNNIRIEPGQTVTCIFHSEATLVDLRLDKTDDGLAAEPGDTIVYSLTYRNAGNKNAEAVVITEQVPEHTTFVGPIDQWSCPPNAPAGTICTSTIGMLVGGSSIGTVQFNAKVNSTLPAAATQVENVARIGHSGNATAAESNEITPIEGKVGLSLSKDDGGAGTTAAGNITYLLTYRNEGTQAVEDVVISETVPAHTTFVGPSDRWSCAVGTLPGTICRHTVGQLPGQTTGTISFQVKVAENLPADLTQITNRAVIGAPINPNADEGNDHTPINASPDLMLVVSDNNVTVAPGENLRYRLSYENVSARAVVGVNLTATLPPQTRFNSEASSSGWQCNITACTYPIGSLPSGSGSSVDLTITVDRPLAAGTTNLLFNARIDDNGQNGADLTPQNNATTATTGVVAPLALLVTKRDTLLVDVNGDGKAGPGDTIEYVIVIRNDGGLGLRQLTLTDELDPHVELVAGITISQGMVSKGNNATDRQVAVNVGDIAGAGGSATLRFRVVVDKPLAAGVAHVANQAIVRSPDFADRATDDPDTTTANDATETALEAIVQLRADLNDFLFVDADNDVTVSVGDTLIYQLTLQNVGDVNSGPLVINVPRDPNVSLVAGTVSSSRGVVVGGDDPDDDISVTLDDLRAGSAVLVTFQMRIVSANAAVIQHQANINAESVSGWAGLRSDDPDLAGASDATITPLGSAPPLRFFYLPLISR